MRSPCPTVAPHGSFWCTAARIGSSTSRLVSVSAMGALKTYTSTGVDEPRSDRAGRYIGLTRATPAEAVYLWDWQAGRIVLQTAGDPDMPFIHVASLRDRWYGVDWNLSQPYEYVVFDPVARTQTLLGGPTNSGDEYGNGNWIQHPADLDDQWALFSHFEGLVPSGSGWLAPGGMVYVTANGQRRLLGDRKSTRLNSSHVKI